MVKTVLSVNLNSEEEKENIMQDSKMAIKYFGVMSLGRNK